MYFLISNLLHKSVTFTIIRWKKREMDICWKICFPLLPFHYFYHSTKKYAYFLRENLSLPFYFVDIMTKMQMSRVLICSGFQIGYPYESGIWRIIKMAFYVCSLRDRISDFQISEMSNHRISNSFQIEYTGYPGKIHIVMESFHIRPDDFTDISDQTSGSLITKGIPKFQIGSRGS